MHRNALLLAIGMIAAVPALANAPDAKAARDAANWDTLLKLYPPRALAARQEGLVGVRVTLDSKGAVKACEVTHSSGHKLLDEETCNLITLHVEFGAPREPMAASQTITKEGVINWRLPNSTAALNAPKAVAAAAAPEKIICKKTVRTGTLSGFDRTCMTAKEWGRMTDDMRENWNELQGRKGSTSGN